MQLQKCIEGLQEVPQFSAFPFRDKNPLGGTEKVRLIRAPNQAMRIVHARFIKQIRKLHVELPFATGARPGDSVRRNVLRHRRSRFFYLVDLHSAYRNVNRERLAKILSELSGALSAHESEVCDFLRRFSLAPEGGLIVGAPASPDLFNLYAGLLIDRPGRRDDLLPDLRDDGGFLEFYFEYSFECYRARPCSEIQRIPGIRSFMRCWLAG